MIRTLAILLVMCLTTAVLADDRLILRDGREIEGTIVKEDDRRIVIMTARGRKVYSKKHIREVLRAEQEESEAEPVEQFHALPPMARLLRNAHAESILGRHQPLIDRLSPLIEEDVTDAQQLEARWLMIEAYERLAEFDQAEKLLKQIKEQGEKANRIRAEAHLDIFEQNPGYKLERVNNKLARKFLPRKLYLKGKEPDALADGVLMRKALEEYADQILLNKKVSLQAFKESLDLEETLEALREMPTAGRVEKYLPHREHLQKVEKSIARAQAILPGYADSYELDLIRSEAEHLQQAIETLFNEVFADYPENASYAYDPENGKLTKEGREQWRENCEEFLEKVKPLIVAAEYVLTRTARFPRALDRVHTSLTNILNRLKRTREAINRKKDTRTYV